MEDDQEDFVRESKSEKIEKNGKKTNEKNGKKQAEPSGKDLLAKANNKDEKNNKDNRNKKSKHLDFYAEKLKQKEKIIEENNALALKEQKEKEALKLREKKLKKKAFSEKTKRGQPVMKNYINLLLNKIEKNKGKYLDTK